jgi:hypothetical protein
LNNQVYVGTDNLPAVYAWIEAHQKRRRAQSDGLCCLTRLSQWFAFHVREPRGTLYWAMRDAGIEHDAANTLG